MVANVDQRPIAHLTKNAWLGSQADVYQADVQNDTNDEKKFYLGVSETPFK